MARFGIEIEFVFRCLIHHIETTGVFFLLLSVFSCRGYFSVAYSIYLKKKKMNTLQKYFYPTKFMLICIGIYVLFYEKQYIPHLIAANILSTLPMSLIGHKDIFSSSLAVTLSYTIFKIKSKPQFLCWTSVYAIWNVYFCHKEKMKYPQYLIANLIPFFIAIICMPTNLSVQQTIVAWSLVRATSILFIFMEHFLKIKK